MPHQGDAVRPNLNSQRELHKKSQQKRLTLTRFETWIALTNHIYFAFAAHDLAIAVALFRRFQRR